MYFKRGLLLVVIGLVFGCGIKVNEKAPEPKTIGLDGSSYSCVGKIAEKVELYINDNLSEEEINEFADCLQNAFISFGRLTRGSAKGTYRPEELRKFIQDNFLKNKVISDELLHEFMVIKQGFLGGSINEVNHADLAAAIGAIEDFRREAIHMKPHIKVLNLTLLRTQSPEGLGQKLHEAQEALNLSITKLTSRLLENQRPYSFNNLAAFMEQFREFIEWDKHFPNSKPVGYWIQFAKIFKELNVSNGQNEILANEWSEVLRSFGRWYIVALQYEVGVKNQTLFSGSGFDNANFLATETFRLLEDAIRVQPDNIIHFEQIDRLISAILDLDWLPNGLRAETVSKIVRVFLNRIFGQPNVRPCDRQEGGLNEYNLTHMESEFNRWVSIQKNLIYNFGEKENEVSQTPLVTGRMAPPIAPEITLPAVAANLNIRRSADWDDFVLFEKTRPLFRDDVPRIFLVPESDIVRLKVDHDFYELSVINAYRSLANLIFRGYADGASPVTWTSTITESEMEEFYEDILDLGIDLKWLDNRNLRVGRRIFLEGNLFTYAADGVRSDSHGNGLMDMSEAVEITAFLVSGGQLSSDLYRDLSEVCQKGPEDHFNKPKLNRKCVEQGLSEALAVHMSNAPGLVRYLNSLDQRDKEKYAHILLETSFGKYSSRDWVEASELSTVSVISQYSEAVLTRYDLNNDGALDEDEVAAAFSTFEGLIDKILQSLHRPPKSSWQKLMGLKYIVAFKVIPSDGWLTSVDIYLRDVTYWGFGIHADRMELAQVFQAITQQLVQANDATALLSPKACAATSMSLISPAK